MTQSRFTYDDSTHTYRLDGKKMTGCTTILGVLNKPALVGWAARMACEYVRENLLQRAFPHLDEGVYDPEEFDAVLKEAQNAHTKKKEDGAKKGTDTHALVENFVNRCIEINGGYAKNMGLEVDQPIIKFIEWAQKENIKFLASEKQFYSENLFVAGTADLVFEKDGKRFIGDIKTYKKIWDRVPFYQCAGYALMSIEMGEAKYDGYCIINLPKERNFKEDQDIKWSFDTEGDTKAFLACAEIYRQNSNF